MANSIEYAKKFVPIIDGVYKAESVTNGRLRQSSFT